MKTASVHDLKNDLKIMFVNRFIGLGFELPVIVFSGTILMSIALDKPVSCSSCTFRTLHNTCAS